MLFPLSSLFFLGVSALPTEFQNRQDYGVTDKVRCGAVNFVVTAFLPQALVTALCSAYSQIPKRTTTSTITATASSSTITEVNNQFIPTLTKIVTTTTLSTTTTTLDSWRGKPACSKGPTFDWIHGRERKNATESAGILDQACKCLDISTFTELVIVVETTTPTCIVTKGIRSLTEVTSTKTVVAVETKTKTIFLLDQAVETSVKNVDIRQNEKIAPLQLEEASGHGENRSSLHNTPSDVEGLQEILQLPDISDSEMVMRMSVMS